MILVSVLSASFLFLPVQGAVAPPAPGVTATRTLDHVTLKAHGVTITAVMEKLKQEAQIETAQIDPKFADRKIDGEWTARDWDELLFVALSGIPEMKVLVVGGPEGTDWQVAGGSEQFVTDFKLKRLAQAAEKAPARNASAPSGTVPQSASGEVVAAEVPEPEAAKTEEEVKTEQAQSLATFVAIVSPPAGPPVAGQQVALPFPNANGDVPIVNRETGPIQLPFPGYVASAAVPGPYPPSKDPAMQALINIVNQKPAPKQ